MPETKPPKVSTGNVFSFNAGALSPIAGTGTLQTNLDIATGAAARPRIGTNEILSDGPSAVVAGVEAGANRATTHLPNLAGAAGGIASGAQIIGATNDIINVGQHVVEGNGAEAVTELLGVAGQASGAAAGAVAGLKLGVESTPLTGPYAPAVTVVTTTIGAGLGAYGGADGWKKIGTLLTGGDTPDKIGPPLTLPNDVPLQPTVTTTDGSKYALVQVDGKYTWFAMLNNDSVPNQYVEVVRGAVVAELTKNYLGAAGFEQQVATYNAEVAAYNSQVAQDSFIRSEINYSNQSGAVANNLRNGLAPDGSTLGQQQNLPNGSSVVWTRDATSGNLIRIATTGTGNNRTAVEERYDASTGQPMGGVIYQPDGQGGFKQIPFGNAGAHVASDAATPPPTVFNPATALGNAPSSDGTTPGYVVQPGDTVGAIALKLGLTPQQYGDYLKSVYGPDADLNSIVAGRELPVPDFAPHAGSSPASGGATDNTSPTTAPSADNDYQAGASNGEAEAAAYIANQNSNTNASTAPTLEDALIDAFSNPTQYSNANDILLADAGDTQGNGDVLSDAGPGYGASVGDPASNQPVAPVNTAQPATETIANAGNVAAVAAPVATPAPNPTSFDAYVHGAGAFMSVPQQAALSAQLSALDPNGTAGLSLVPLPGGGVLIGNAAGEVVGEIGVAPDGELHLQSQRVNADGSSASVDLHIAGNGLSTSYSPYQLGQVNATLNLLQGLDGLQHWDKMDDLGHFSSLLGLANSINTLSNGSLGNLSSLNTFSSFVGLAQNIEHGNVLGTLSSINALNQVGGQGAIDAALNSALGSSGVPYLSIAVALNDFEHHPGQSIGSLIGMYWGPLGSAIGGTIGSLLDAAGLFGDNRPPPPEGATHYEWDAEGNIQIRVDFNQSQGGEMAQSTAQSVQGLLESIVQSINDQTPDTADNVALNPYLLPRVGFSQSGGAWIEMTTPDGGSYREVIQGQNQSQGLAQRLFEVLTENGGIAPAWQVQTQLGHMQQLLAEGAGQAEIAAELGAGAGGHAYHGNQAYALEGNATESADFKTQSFGALVVHLGAQVVDSDAVRSSTQALQTLQDQQTQDRVQTSTLYRDTEGDGYFEQTQWVSATDAQGNAQGLLVLDYNGNGQIETRDILNLGGNLGEEGNLANDALAATANAHLQRNNVQWLDANGDNVLDASDPAFAAIKLWVDVNQDARLDAGEHADLASLQITSINLRDGAVTYADGHSDALSVTTLQSDTEGVRYTQVQEADAEGNLHTVHAGQMLEHEGYQGQVQVTDQDGIVRWGNVREATFEHEALRTGDWEGTAEQDQHRHGGTNVASAPTQTSATGAVSLGPVRRVEGQGQALSDRRVVFVPAIAAQESQGADKLVEQMVRSAQEAALGGGMGGGMGLGALAMVGLGAVQTTALAAPNAVQTGGSQGEREEADPKAAYADEASRPRPSYGSVASPQRGGPAVQEVAQGTWQEEPRQVVDAPPPPGVLADVQALQQAGLDLSAYAAAGLAVREVQATLVRNSAASTPGTPAATASTPTVADAEVLLDSPKVAGEVLAGTEDTVLRIDTALLLANDSTANADAALRISAVGHASHGQVSLQTRVNGAGETVTDVVFVPDPDFYGTASFSYTVTDAYGLSSTATATVLVDNVNDAPYAQGEVVSGASEDASFLIDKTVLLVNDGDVDDANSALGIGWVGNALNGTVSLDANGNVVFVPGLNFNGNAEFEYRTVDPVGLLSPAVPVVLPVAAVNDAPLGVDDQFQTYVNSTMTIGFAQLIGNDTDIENDTLSLVDVGNASQGVVSIVDGQVQFVPTAGFTGTASFDYLADDGNGGQTWATAYVEVKPPPNLYASVNLLGTSFYGTEYNSGRAIDVASASWSIQDDGDTAFATIQLQSISVYLAGGLASSPSWSSLIGVNFFTYSTTGMSMDIQRWAAFTEFQSSWQVTDNRGLSNIWHFNYSMSGGATSYMEHSGYVGPVVLSLDGLSPAYTSTQYSNVRFDIDLDGVADKLAWAAPGSGVLGLDLDGDGQISSASEFAFRQYVEGAQTDLEGLRAFDTNGNGELDAGDAQWARFGVWEDKNADGQTQDGEYLGLEALGIASIHLQSNAQVHSGGALGGGVSADVTVMGDTTFTRTDGSTGLAADAMLAYQSGVDAQAAEADLARMALLFNQMANTALAVDATPLGFVPVQATETVFANEELMALQAA